MKKRYTPFLLFCIYAAKSLAQVPTTDIYLLDMKIRHGKYFFTNPQKISDWNGYNNQPYFSPDGKSVYYVSYRNKQSDIYRYNLDTKQTNQFTHSPEDEYSPRLSPDGKYISVVRVMKDSAQQLWEFPIQGGAPSLVLKGYDSIGYYFWRGNEIMTVNVPEPMNLRLTSNPQNDSFSGQRYIPYINMGIKSIGRTALTTSSKREEFLFVQKPVDKKDSINLICKIDERHFPYKISIIIKTLPNCEDFAIGPKNTLYMGCKGKLYSYRMGRGKNWKEIADFSGTEFKNFYRIAVNKAGNRIALVSYQGKKP